MKKVFKVFGIALLGGMLLISNPTAAQTAGTNTEVVADDDEDDNDDAGKWGLLGLAGLLGLLGLKRRDDDGRTRTTNRS